MLKIHWSGSAARLAMCQLARFHRFLGGFAPAAPPKTHVLCTRKLLKIHSHVNGHTFDALGTSTLPQSHSLRSRGAQSACCEGSPTAHNRKSHNQIALATLHHIASNLVKFYVVCSAPQRALCWSQSPPQRFRPPLNDGWSGFFFCCSASLSVSIRPRCRSPVRPF